MTGPAASDNGAYFRLPVRVYYEDTDAGGVVYYANYLKYLERARTEWLRAAGWGQTALAGDRGLLFAVRSIELDYHAPARLDDALEIEARIAALGRARIDFAQRVLRDGEPLCTGGVRVACLDAGTFRPRALPDDMKEVFAGDD
ncbi:MAG: tol-pal system-associated acyl-CoA thioesterase [Halofilum sp. (in: g-proteobacteria)]